MTSRNEARLQLLSDQRRHQAAEDADIDYTAPALTQRAGSSKGTAATAAEAAELAARARRAAHRSVAAEEPPAGAAAAASDPDTIERDAPDEDAASVVAREDGGEDDTSDDDAEPAGAADTEAAPTSTEATGTGRRGQRVAGGVVALLLVAALAVCAIGWARSSDRASSAARSQTSAMAAATTYAVDLTSYNYQHLTADFQVVLNHSTSTFAAKFKQSSSALAPVLTKYKASSTAKVLAAGVTSATSSQATVLLEVSETATNTNQKHGPTTDSSSVSMTLVRQHGQWLINAVTLL